MSIENHKTEIIDTNPHFKIDGITRTVTNESEVKIAIMQGDHNSQRFTFEIPRYIDSHDMSTCNLVQVHFLNGSNPGLYVVDDLMVDPENPEIATCSWLISSEATKIIGNLNFAIRFACVTDKKYEYVWNTSVFTGLSVSTSMDSGDAIVDEYIDILEQWKEELFNSVPEVTIKRKEYGSKITVNNPAGTTESEIYDGTKITLEQVSNGVVINSEDHDGTNTVKVYNGKDAIPPTLTIERKNDGVTVTIQNGDNHQSATVYDGLIGERGQTGAKGETGDSAYELAVANGFAGTEKEWLSSLKGEKGDIGLTGQSGADATNEQVQNSVNTYMQENQLEMMSLDDSLSLADHAADAKATGEKFAEMTKYIDDKVVNATIAATREDLAGLYEEQYSYGFVEHMDILSPGSRIEYLCQNKNYTPMSLDMSAHTTNYGSWKTFPSILKNKPYMVKPTGEADYQLDDNNYALKVDGSASDVANTSYEGGAFSKFIKIYVKRWIEGNDRHVRFSYIPIEGYTACGFIDTDGSEMDHVWLPMFYGATVDGKMRSLSGLQPDINQNTSTQYSNITAFSDRAAFFAGPIIETIRDMLYMLFKTTDLQASCGSGNSGGYKSDAPPYYGVLPNAVVGSGQFYGTSNSKSLNKIFHSIVLGSYNQWQRDPYYLVVNGRFKVSVNYTYDITGASYIDTGIDSETVDASKWLYPNVSTVVDKFGSVPKAPFSGSTSTGYCDGVYHPQNKEFTAVVLRFGGCGDWSTAGLACLTLDYGAGTAYWSISTSVLLRPPVAA